MEKLGLILIVVTTLVLNAVYVTYMAATACLIMLDII